MGQLLAHFVSRPVNGPHNSWAFDFRSIRGPCSAGHHFSPTRLPACYKPSLQIGPPLAHKTFGLLLARKVKGPTQNWHLFWPAKGTWAISIYTTLSSFRPVDGLLRAVVTVGHIIWDPLNIILTSPIKARFDYTRLFVCMASKKCLGVWPLVSTI